MLKKTPEPLNLKICKNLSFIVLQSTLKKPKSDLKKYFLGPKMSKIGLDLVKGNILFSFSSVLVYAKFNDFGVTIKIVGGLVSWEKLF